MPQLDANPYEIEIDQLFELEQELMLRLHFASRRIAEAIVLRMKRAKEEGQDYSRIEDKLKAKYDTSMSTCMWCKDMLEFDPQWDDYKDKLYRSALPL